MKFLLENEMSFSPVMLGFPSIQGCHAIVYQTRSGLYGYHNAGGSRDEDFPIRAGLFRQFVSNVGALGETGTRLYGVTFVSNNQRGYSGVPKERWLMELKAFATALGYGGRISGYDLSDSLGATDSAYVEYRVNGEKCDVFVRRWNRGAEQTQTGVNTTPNLYVAKTGHRSAPTLAAPDTVITFLNRGNLTQVSKSKLN
jgi:hypothetical protein